MASQFSLLGQRRLGPLFATQALGAFNDNVFKTALSLLISFGVSVSASQSNVLINVAAGLFILPFFLFSAQAGQLADRMDKATLIRRVKMAEIAVMTVGAIGLVTRSIPVLLFTLFCMGAQSALFGPAKYAILPQHVSGKELVGANGLLGMGTFLAILTGNIAAGLLMAEEGTLPIVAMLVVGIAALGFTSSLLIPSAPPVAAQQTPFDWHLPRQTLRTLGFLRGEPTLLNAVLGVAWFWFFGATYLTQLPNYVRLTLGGDETVVTLLLALFSIGIAAGSLLCSRLSGGKVEIGLVPLGSIGMTLFAIDLYFTPAVADIDTLRSASAWLGQSGSVRAVIDIVLLGVFGGLYIVPLNALIQQRAEPHKRARIIAANNIVNAGAMTLAAVFAIVTLGAGLSIPQLFLTLAAMNAVVALYIYTLVPEFFLRFVIWVLIHTIYRVEAKNLDAIPDEGPALLVCNHVSFVDSLIVGGMIRRPVRFVMYHKIYRTPGLRKLFDIAGAVPIAPAKEDPVLLEQAMNTIAEKLRDGEVVCVFPEGILTPSGDITEFKTGVERILERTPVPVIPMALSGLWGSWFSRARGKAMASWPRRFHSKIRLSLGNARAPDTTAAALQADVATLRGDWA